jgi:hypothetical protein
VLDKFREVKEFEIHRLPKMEFERNLGIYLNKWKESSLLADDLKCRKFLFQGRDWSSGIHLYHNNGISFFLYDRADFRDHVLNQHLSPPSISSPSLPPKVIQDGPVPPRSPTPEPVNLPTPTPTPPPPPPPQETESRQFAIGCISQSDPILTIAYLENGQDLRSVFIPSTLRERFLKIAEPNTQRNIETCGILCGVLVHIPLSAMLMV